MQNSSQSLDPTQVERVAGYYELATPRNQILNFILRFVDLQRVQVKEGRVVQSHLVTGAETELIPVTGDSFRTQSQPIATLFLVSDEQDTIYLQSGIEGHLRKASAFKVWSLLFSAGLVMSLLISALVFGPVWIVTRAFGRMAKTPASLVLPQFLASLSLFGTIVLMIATLRGIDDLVRVSFATVSLCVGTVVFAVLSLYLTFRVIRPVSVEAGPFVRNWSRLVSIAAAVMTTYLASEGIIGIRLWSD